MINRSNYESYIIDYLEGNLDAVMVSELLLFMEQHEDLKAELELLAPGFSSVHAPENVLINKSFLKKPVYEDIKSESNELFVARLEGDITKDQVVRLTRLQHLYPELRNDALLFTQTRLIPDTAIVYPDKRLLRRQETIRLFPNWLKAAAVLLMMGFGWLLFKPAGKIINQVALENGKTTKDLPVKAEAGAGTLVSRGDRNDNTDIQRKKTIQPEVSQVAVNTYKQNRVTPELQDIRSTAEIMLLALQPVSAGQPEMKAELPLAATDVKINYPALAGNEPEGYVEIPEVIYAGIKLQKDQVLTERNKPAETKTADDARWAALSLFNKLTGADVKVIKTYDRQGKVAGIEIAARNFEYAVSK